MWGVGGGEWKKVGGGVGGIEMAGWKGVEEAKV